MISGLISVITFVVVLSTLIVIHELGHFIIARRNGVKVDEFSIGFGKIIFKKKMKDFDFLVCAVPLGGYVKLAGESAEASKGFDYEYCSKSVGRRAQVIAAGPIFNYIFAWFCLFVVFMFGILVPVNESRIGTVLIDSPAEHAGIQENDLIIRVGDKPVQDWQEMSEAIRAFDGDLLKIYLLREGILKTVDVEVEHHEIESEDGQKETISLIGVAPFDEIKRFGFFESIYRSFLSLMTYTWITVKSLIYIITGKLALKDSVSGPIGIFVMTSKISHFGILAIIHFMAILSLSLCIFNFLPLPILDGGHLFFLLLEKIRKKPVSAKTEDILSRIGIVCISILILFTIFNDILKFGFKNQEKETDVQQESNIDR